MNIRKVIQRRLRHRGDGLDVDADVNAVVAANVGERRSSTHVSARQRSRALTDEELRRERAESLPDREAMSLIPLDPSVPPPIDEPPAGRDTDFPKPAK